MQCVRRAPANTNATSWSCPLPFIPPSAGHPWHLLCVSQRALHSQPTSQKSYWLLFSLWEFIIWGNPLKCWVPALAMMIKKEKKGKKKIQQHAESLKRYRKQSMFVLWLCASPRALTLLYGSSLQNLFSLLSPEPPPNPIRVSISLALAHKLTQSCIPLL